MSLSLFLEWRNYTGSIGVEGFGKSTLENVVTSELEMMIQDQRTTGGSLIKVYWEIGCYIVTYGQEGCDKVLRGGAFVKSLSQVLTERYGKGFSHDNLSHMRKLFIFFPYFETLRNEQLTWSHFTELLKAETKAEVYFYKEQAEANRWSVRQLRQQMKAHYYYHYELYSVLTPHFLNT